MSRKKREREEHVEEGAPGAKAAEGAPVAEAPAAPPDPAAEWRDRYLRALAELDNYRKRADREREIARTYATEGLLRDLLPVIDDLETALTIGGSLDAIREGVALALRHLVTELEAKGMKPIEALGQPFDPRIHEAMGIVPAPGKPPGTIIAELRRGYCFHDRILRPSRVQIAMAQPAPEPPAEE
jgi:molecular chaperone GrpE